MPGLHILKRLVGALIMTLIVGVAVLAVATRIGWIAAYDVETGSMNCHASTHSLCANPGDLVVSHRVAASDLHVGDVVTAQIPGRARGVVVTHRIRQITQHGQSATITLRGDANSHNDATTYTVDEADRATYVVHGWGAPVRFLLTFPGLWFLIGLYAAGAITYLAWPRRQQREEKPLDEPIAPAPAADLDAEDDWLGEVIAEAESAPLPAAHLTDAVPSQRSAEAPHT